MTELGRLISVNSLEEFRAAAAHLAATRWRSDVVYYLTYDDGEQVLRFNGKPLELRPDCQVGTSALSLRPCSEQELSWPEELPSSPGFRLSIPLFHFGSLQGVLALNFAQEPTAAVINDIKSLAYLLGIVVNKVQQLECDRLFMERCQEFLVRAVEARSQRGHVQRCSRLVSSLAEMLDLSPQVKSELMQATQYHDIGLLCFSDARAVDAEREHAAIGARLLGSHPDLLSVAHLVEFHHERYDGSGQPKGKKQDDLPLEGWVLALAEDVVETWEAHPGNYTENVKRFFNDSAKHHHPDVVDALCGLVDSNQLEELLM